MRLTQSIRQSFVRAVMDDVPKIDYAEKVCKLAQESALRALPPPIAKASKDKELSKHLESSYCGFGHGISTRVPGRIQRENFNEADKQALADLVAKHLEQDEQRDKLEDKLNSCAQSCSTRKLLAEMLPEFSKYLPAEYEPLKNLPVVTGLVDDFTKAGWPKKVKAK